MPPEKSQPAPEPQPVPSKIVFVPTSIYGTNLEEAQRLGLAPEDLFTWKLQQPMRSRSAYAAACQPARN